MIYKVQPGSEAHLKFCELMDEIDYARKVHSDFLYKVKAKTTYILKLESFAGIDGVQFEGEVDRSIWKRKAFEIEGEWFIPKKSSPIYNEFNALPIVKHHRIAQIVGYRYESGPPIGTGGHKASWCPGFYQLENINEFIITTASWSKWRPDPNILLEITQSQLDELKKINKSSKPQSHETIR